jgi:hypothetical protein
VESTPIAYENYLEFKVLVHKAFEGLILSRQVINGENDVYEIDYFVIDKVFNHGTISDIEKVLKRYGGRSIKAISNNTKYDHRKLSYQIESLGKSIAVIKKLKTLKSGGQNYEISQTVRSKIENCLVLSSNIDLGKEENVAIFDAVIKYFMLTNIFNWREQYFSEFIFKVKDNIDLDRLIKYAKIIVSNLEIANRYNLVSAIGLIRSKMTQGQNLDKLLPSLVEKIIANKGLNKTQKERILINIHEYLSINEKSVIENYFIKRLNEKFNLNIYYRAVINDVIDYRPWFDEYVAKVPTVFKDGSFKESMTGEKEDMIFELNQLIQICFKFKIKIPDSMPPPSTYYEWLINMGDFDEDNFNVFWLNKFRVVTYIEEYKKHQYIKSSVEKFLKSKNDDLIQELYFNHLI